MSNFDAIIRAAKAPKEKSSTKAVGKPKQPITVQQAGLLLEQIRDRESQTRKLSSAHVETLADSIAVLGLLEPLVVDSQNFLLAGRHRFSAIQLLNQNNPEAFKKHFPDGVIPVHVLPFDAVVEPERALQVEVAENEHRRDYTPAEVRALADILRASGYVDQPGRPMKGKKALRPALEVIVGKSLRTVQRYLNESSSEQPTEKPRQGVRVSEEQALRQALKKLQEWETITATVAELSPNQQRLEKQLPKFMKLLETVLEEAAS